MGFDVRLLSRKEYIMLASQQIKKLGDDIAKIIGWGLGQEYHWHENKWWLFSLGKPSRPLEPDEVAWHVSRNHAPFVEGGIEKDDPRWFDDP